MKWYQIDKRLSNGVFIDHVMIKANSKNEALQRYTKNDINMYVTQTKIINHKPRLIARYILDCFYLEISKIEGEC